MKTTKIAGTLLLLLASTALLATPAQAEERSLRGVVGAGISFGGDTLATVTFSDGSSEDIKSGGLFHVYGGAELRVAPRMTLQATIGYHVDDTSAASNGGLRFSRYPVELLAHYQLGSQFRLGGGARFVNNAKLAGSGNLSAIDAKFDATTGLVLEGEYFVTPSIGLKLRAVGEKYKPSGGGMSVDGNHFGLSFSWYP